jgi:hypothetical protein
MTNNNNIHLSIPYNILILLFSMLLCGTISVTIGKDLDWDLANYHYSNAYLFLHHHLNQDIFPPSYVHVHFAPTADFLSYFLINYFTPIQATFISGAIHGINLWLVFQIAFLFLKNHTLGILLSIIIALIGIDGCSVFFCIGNFKNDLLISIFILFFIFSQIKSLQYYKDNNTYKNNNTAWMQWLLIGGVSSGIAVGLKLTAAVYLAGAVMAYCVLPIRLIDRGKCIFILGLSCFIGFLFSSGYWMWIQWNQYHNPVFPFLNSIFHSPYYQSSNLVFTNTRPQNIWHQIFLSPYFLFYPKQFEFIDIRYFYLYALLIVTGIHFLWGRYRNTQKKRLLEHKKILLDHKKIPLDHNKISLDYNKISLDHNKISIDYNKISLDHNKIQLDHKKLPLEITWLCFFVIFPPLFFQRYFDGLRYVASIEMLIPLIIYLLVNHLMIHANTRNIVITLLFFTMIISMKPNITGTRVPSYKKNYFNVTLPDVIKNTPDALALIPYPEYAQNADPRPIMFLTAFLPSHWRFIGIPFEHALQDTSDKKSDIKIRYAIETYPGKIYFLTPVPFLSDLYKAAFHFNLIPDGHCSEIDNERSLALLQKVVICPVKKISTLPYSTVASGFISSMIDAI